MITPPPPATQVAQSLRLGYGVGSLCAATFGALPGLLLLFYLTNILAVPALLAGIVVFLPKGLDLIVNPVVGRLSDRTHSRMGPRRPWVLAGACTLPVAFALVFAGPSLRGGSAALYVGLFFILASIFFSVFEVPYRAMPAEMTDDYHERTALLQWRIVFIGVAAAVSGILAPAIANSEGESGTVASYRLMGLVVAVVLLAAMLATFFGTARARVVRPDTAAGSLRSQLAAARSNRDFLWLVTFSSLQLLTVGVMLAGGPYFATYVLGDPKAVSTLFVAIVGPMLITMPAWLWVSRRLEKRGTMILAELIFLAGAAGAAGAPWFGLVYAHLSMLLVGIGYAGLRLLDLSMLADVVAHDRETTGTQRGGVLTGLWTAIENGVMALGAVVYGATLAVGGFLESDPQHPVDQPESAYTAVLVGESAVPAAIMFLAVLATLKYTLTADKISAAARHAAGGPGG